MNKFDFIKNDVFTSPVRLTIMLVLLNYKSISLKDLRKVLEIIPGNLDHHLLSLEREGYIIKRKSLTTGNLSMMVTITKKGERDFKKYLSNLRDVLSKFKLD